MDLPAKNLASPKDTIRTRALIRMAGSDERYGQAVFNLAYLDRPVRCQKIVDENFRLDPFNDDNKVEAFLDAVYSEDDNG